MLPRGRLRALDGLGAPHAARRLRVLDAAACARLARVEQERGDIRISSPEAKKMEEKQAKERGARAEAPCGSAWGAASSAPSAVTAATGSPADATTLSKAPQPASRASSAE